MLTKIVALSVPALLGTYYLIQRSPISLTNPHLANLLTRVHQYKPEYSIIIFKVLLKLRLLESDSNLSKYILKSGFDIEGKYIQEAQKLGFAGIEVGPISFNPTQKQQSEQHLGIRSAIARICGYRQNRQQSQFKIQLNVVPNHQVLKFAPYLVKENLIQALEAYTSTQKLVHYPLIDQINMEFNRKDIELGGRQSQQVQKMIRETRQEAEKLMKSVEQQVKTSIGLSFGLRNEGYLDWADLLGYISKQKVI